MEIKKFLQVENEGVLLFYLEFNIKGLKLKLSSNTLKDVNWNEFLENEFARIKEKFSDISNNEDYIIMERLGNAFTIKLGSRAGYEVELNFLFSEIKDEIEALDTWCKTYITF
jgi:hypothetical protein